MKKIKRPKAEPAPVKPYEYLYQLKIHLLDINPQVYRRFVVRGDTTVVQLHHIVQLVMGWDNNAVTVGTCITFKFLGVSTASTTQKAISFWVSLRSLA